MSSQAVLAVTGKLRAEAHAGVRAAVGQVVAVQGKVESVDQTRNGSVFFLKFAGAPRGEFVGIVMKENYDAVVVALGVDLKTARTGKNIELRGEIVLYKDISEIIVRSPAQLS